MDRDELIRSRAHRILGKLSRYQALSKEESTTSHILDKGLLRDMETEVGVYENSKTDIRENVIITNQGVHVFLESWFFVGYEEIDKVQIPLSQEGDKRSVRMVEIQQQSGTTIRIPVVGGDEKTRDAWEVLHFLQRVVNDLRKRPKSTP